MINIEEYKRSEVITDIPLPSEKKDLKKQRAKREGKLMRKCFKGNRVYVGDSSILVHGKGREHKLLVEKRIREPEMKVHGIDFYNEAYEFAQVYEDKFMSYGELMGKRFWIELCGLS